MSATEVPPVPQDTEVHAPVAPGPPPPPSATPPPGRGPRLWMVLLAGAVGALLTLGLDAWFRWTPSPRPVGRHNALRRVPPTEAAPPEMADPAPARDLVCRTPRTPRRVR